MLHYAQVKPSDVCTCVETLDWAEVCGSAIIGNTEVDAYVASNALIGTAMHATVKNSVSLIFQLPFTQMGKIVSTRGF